ncbi:hypothetical protein HYH02_009481 [Chlamydomonas schloesseri]|uniref:Uncharacterized protein n=1 Tax=Chlamydomonas schloesseri TaxID=2026947 RepID=A0A835W9Y2_9CHLO|nr:hypothetical protein HYH02_009481 [Chlamydomonas schloesseri]|eukprot:KAG2443066.1 hypothetical protein HYH02_009481 [Chlamydomonas schloesseri]
MLASRAAGCSAATFAASLPHVVIEHVAFWIAELGSPNDVPLALRHVCKGWAAALAAPEHRTAYLSAPSQPAAFAAHWGKPCTTAPLSLHERRMLLCLTAASGSIPNLELLARGPLLDGGRSASGSSGADGGGGGVGMGAAGCSLTADVAAAAAAAGDLPMSRHLRTQLHCPWDDRVLKAAARSGNEALVAWLLQAGCPGAEQLLAAAAEAGHVHLCPRALEATRLEAMPPPAAIACVVGALALAAAGGHGAAVDWLLQVALPCAGRLPPGARYVVPLRPVVAAASRGHVRLAEELLARRDAELAAHAAARAAPPPPPPPAAAAAATAAAAAAASPAASPAAAPNYAHGFALPGLAANADVGGGGGSQLLHTLPPHQDVLGHAYVRVDNWLELLGAFTHFADLAMLQRVYPRLKAASAAGEPLAAPPLSFLGDDYEPVEQDYVSIAVSSDKTNDAEALAKAAWLLQQGERPRAEGVSCSRWTWCCRLNSWCMGLKLRPQGLGCGAVEENAHLSPPRRAGLRALGLEVSRTSQVRAAIAEGDLPQLGALLRKAEGAADGDPHFIAMLVRLLSTAEYVSSEEVLEATWAARGALSVTERRLTLRGLRTSLHTSISTLHEEQADHMRCWCKDVARGLLVADSVNGSASDGLAGSSSSSSSSSQGSKSGRGNALAPRRHRQRQAEWRAAQQQRWPRLAGWLIEEMGPKALAPFMPPNPAALQYPAKLPDREPLLLVGAAAAGRLDIAQWLVRLGAPWSLPGEHPANRGREELTALYAAARGGNAQLLEWALANGCPCPVAPGSGPCSAAHWPLLRPAYEEAARDGDLAMLRLLVRLLPPPTPAPRVPLPYPSAGFIEAHGLLGRRSIAAAAEQPSINGAKPAGPNAPTLSFLLRALGPAGVDLRPCAPDVRNELRGELVKLSLDRSAARWLQGVGLLTRQVSQLQKTGDQLAAAATGARPQLPLQSAVGVTGSVEQLGAEASGPGAAGASTTGWAEAALPSGAAAVSAPVQRALAALQEAAAALCALLHEGGGPSSADDVMGLLGEEEGDEEEEEWD